MNPLQHIRGLLLVALISVSGLFAQAQPPVSFSMDGKEITLRISRDVPQMVLDSICSMYGTTYPAVDSLIQANYHGPIGNEGWNLTRWTNKYIEFSKSISSLSGQLDAKDVVFLEDWQGQTGPGYPADVTYGFNVFKQKTVIRVGEDKVRFSLPEHLEARQVMLAGNFNDWSTLKTPMTKTDSGWVITLRLLPGKYFYKFIVDGQWIYDKNNKLHEPDGNGGFNSTYFVTNYTFHLDDHKDAKRVILTGSFNGWNEQQLRMDPVEDGWSIHLYLKEGTHAYKFIVDKEWILDPNNPLTRPDGKGNFNSFMSFGDTFYFRLDTFSNAKSVFVAGNFNAWNQGELEMIKTDSGWVLPYVLAPGNYEYKFIVDGQWMPDPFNLRTNGEGPYTNSVLVIDPNVVFTLSGYADAKTVFCTGSFNGWSETGYEMTRKNGLWQIKLHLDPGKYTYKFIVDGNWILDPGNKLWEQNEHKTGNSVIWVKPEGAMGNSY